MEVRSKLGYTFHFEKDDFANLLTEELGWSTDVSNETRIADFSFEVIGWVLDRGLPARKIRKSRPKIPSVVPQSSVSLLFSRLSALRIVSKSTEDLPDSLLVGLVSSGDESSYGVLYERYRPQLASFLESVFTRRHGGDCEWGSSIDYEDLTQLIFIKTLKYVRNNSKMDFPSFLRTVAYSVSHNYVRSLSKKREFLLSQSIFSNDGLHQLATSRDSFGLGDLLVCETCEYVNEAIDSLPESQKLAVVYAFFHDYYNFPVSFFKARAALKPKFQRYFEENLSEVVELAR